LKLNSTTAKKKKNFLRKEDQTGQQNNQVCGYKVQLAELQQKKKNKKLMLGLE
jgi:hypothetical protein